MPDSLQRIVEVWENQIEIAKEAKYRRFGQDAERAWKYYGEKNHQFLFDTGGDVGAGDVPYYRATINKTFEYVALFIPFLHHRVPNRQVQVRRPKITLGDMPQVPQTPGDVLDEIRANLLQWFLNYTPDVFDLRQEGRDSITESLVKGMGVAWVEMVDQPSGPIPGSFYDSVDNLLLDPDARRLKHASYIVRIRRKPIWEVADQFEIPITRLRATVASHRGQAVNKVLPDSERRFKEGEDKDIVVYYEVFSRCGIGQKFEGTATDDERMNVAMESVGNYVYLAIAPGLKYPLNMQPEAILAAPDPGEYMKAQAQWPIPFYVKESSPWPFASCSYYSKDNSAWPHGPLIPALPLQAFLDYSYSWLMGRIKWTGRAIPVVSAAVQQEFKTAYESGDDLSVVYLKDTQNVDIRKLVDVLDFPQMNGDMWQTISGVERAFEDITAMTPLMRGHTGATQIRSAAEAEIRQANTAIRPDDMADCVEAFMKDLAHKEATAARLYVSPATVAVLAGEDGQLEETEDNPLPEPGAVTTAWAEAVMTDDPWRASAELFYTVESGSGKRPNKVKRQAYLRDMAQVILEPFLQSYNTTGDPTPFNNFMRMLADAHDEDPNKLMLPPMQMQPAPAQGEAPPGGPPVQ